MSLQRLAGGVFVVFGLLFLSHYSVYHWGVASESKRHASAGVLVAQSNQAETLVLQASNDSVAAEHHQQTINLERKNHDLQEQSKKLLGSRPAPGATGDGSNDRADLGQQLQLINQAGDCPGLPDADGEPFAIDTADGLATYTIEIASRYCTVAKQLQSLIKTN